MPCPNHRNVFCNCTCVHKTKTENKTKTGVIGCDVYDLDVSVTHAGMHVAGRTQSSGKWDSTLTGTSATLLRGGKHEMVEGVTFTDVRGPDAKHERLPGLLTL